MGLEAPPVPIEATWSNDIVGVRITFDKPLKPELLLPSNWTLRVAGRARIMTGPNVVDDVVVRSRTVPTGGPVLGNRVSYLATLPDLEGTNDRLVERFIGFPVDIF